MENMFQSVWTSRRNWISEMTVTNISCRLKKEPPLLVTAEALFRRIHSREAACEIVVPERIFDYPVTFSTIARRQIRNVCRSNSYLGELVSASCCASVFRTQCMILAVDFKSRSG